MLAELDPLEQTVSEPEPLDSSAAAAAAAVAFSSVRSRSAACVYPASHSRSA